MTPSPEVGGSGVVHLRNGYLFVVSNLAKTFRQRRRKTHTDFWRRPKTRNQANGQGAVSFSAEQKYKIIKRKQETAFAVRKLIVKAVFR